MVPDSTGALTASNSYDSFGNPTNAAFPTRYQFTGREFDGITGMQYSRARWYDATIGRFISEYPIGFEAGDLNLYGYVQNNPISHADPSGLIDPIVYQDPKIYNFHFAARREGQNLFFGDGGLFTQQTFSEFLSANERSKRKCKSTWTQRFTNNFYETNAALPGLGAPALIPGLGVGTLTSKATASAMNSMTVMEWASTGFRGARIGAATLSAAETGLTVAASTAVNTVLVTVAYEGGVGIGSAINATFGFTDYCPCEQ